MNQEFRKVTFGGYEFVLVINSKLGTVELGGLEHLKQLTWADVDAYRFALFSLLTEVAAIQLGLASETAQRERVSGNALVSGNAQLYGNAQVSGNALSWHNYVVKGSDK